MVLCLVSCGAPRARKILVLPGVLVWNPQQSTPCAEGH